MTDPGETLIENSLSRLGMRTLDVMRYGRAVNVYPWFSMVPGEAKPSVVIYRRVEPELNMHHMLITWYAREMVEMVNTPLKFGVWWWIDKGERMSEAIEMAASLFKLRVGVYPSRCWVNELPKDAPDSYEIEGFSNDPPTRPVTLRMAGWIPERFVCVGIELIEAEIEFANGKYVCRKGKANAPED